MHTIKSISFILILLFSSSYSTIIAQEQTLNTEIISTDGSQKREYLSTENNTNLSSGLITNSDQEKIISIDIDTIENKESEITQKHQASKYLIGESAFGLKKGQSMYQNIMGGINTFGYGFSDNFTLNLSTEIFSLLSGQAGIFLINPKFTFGNEENNVRFGIGTNLLVALVNDDSGSLGSAYGLVTFGSEYKNITAGVGFVYSLSDDIFGESPAVFQLSGTYPISSKFSIMLETFFTLEDGLESFIMPTLRYNYNHITIDLGIVNGALFDNVRIPLLSVSTVF